MRSRLPIVTAALVAALLIGYLGFQGGQLTIGASRTIEFRCNAVEYGLIPYEVTHPGAQLTDPYCQPQPESLMHSGEEPGADAAGHEHPRTDPGIVADAPTWITPLTSTLMHGGLLHLLASVLGLLVFGPRLERRIGHVRFFALFLLSGLVTAAALVLLAPNLPIATIGATGAVAGVIGAHLALVPRARLTMFELPASVLVGAWIALQVAVANLDAAQPVAGAGGDVAYLVPAAGLILGLLLSIREFKSSVTGAAATAATDVETRYSRSS